MKKMEVARLILDFNLYPRLQVDSQHAGYMVESLRAGLELPPVIVDEKSLRVIDGFHRITAIKRFNKEKGMVSVILKKYASEGDMFVDAMLYNGTHGRTLTQYDRTHCIIRAEELKLDMSIIAGALSMSIDKIKELREHRVGVFVPASPMNKKTGKIVRVKSKSFPIQLKRTIEHKAGQVLTEVQIEANEKLSGMDQSFYVNQLITLIESDLLNRESERLMERLECLYELLCVEFGEGKERKIG